MSVPTSFSDLSTTPATNATYISGSDSPIVLDDHLRTVYAFIASVYANSGNGWSAPFLTAANPSYTGTLTGGTGVVNLGSGQFYKDASGNVLINATTANATPAGDDTNNAQWVVSSSRGKFLVQSNANSGGTISVNNTFADTSSQIAVQISRRGSGVGSITASSTATAYNTSSDYRLKANPVPLTGSGEFIDALAPKRWAWVADGSPGVGFIAHEVAAVSPTSVRGEKDAVDGNGQPVHQVMEYGSAEFVANIVAELQSLRLRVAALEAG